MRLQASAGAGRRRPQPGFVRTRPGTGGRKEVEAVATLDACLLRQARRRQVASGRGDGLRRAVDAEQGSRPAAGRCRTAPRDHGEAVAVEAGIALEDPPAPETSGSEPARPGAGFGEQRARAAHGIDDGPVAVPSGREHTGGGDLLPHRCIAPALPVAAAIERRAGGVEQEGRVIGVEAQAQGNVG